MKILKLLILYIVIISLAGCATGYKQLGFNGGYSETHLNENTYSVSFKGSSSTSMERAVDFTLLRGAELALQNGYAYFVVMDSKQWMDYKTYTSPETSESDLQIYKTGDTTELSKRKIIFPAETRSSASPNTTFTITCYKDKPVTDKIIHDARIILDSITNKYKIKK